MHKIALVFFVAILYPIVGDEHDAKGCVVMSTSTRPPGPPGSPDPPDSPASGSSDLVSSLAPVLEEIHQGRLHSFRWFRADWQRGGAATAHATLEPNDPPDPDDKPKPVVVKIPVGDAELRWTRRLQSPDDPSPVAARLYSSDDTLGGYDLAWLVMEDLPYGPLGAHWSDTTIPRMADAAARLYAIAATHPTDRCPMREDWHDTLRGARDVVNSKSVPDPQRWKKALKTVNHHLDHLIDAWRARRLDEWIHGDLHPANAMTRAEDDAAPVVLIDLAEMRPGHWIEDAVYLERLLWTRPERMNAHKPVREIARSRKKVGLPVDDDYQKLAAIRRILMAATAPRFIRTEGSRAHLLACLSHLEQAPAELKRFGL